MSHAFSFTAKPLLEDEECSVALLEPNERCSELTAAEAKAIAELLSSVARVPEAARRAVFRITTRWPATSSVRAWVKKSGGGVRLSAAS